MDLSIALAVFPVIFIGELPDKTMFASLVLASRGRPSSVWLGAAGAFTVHVVIAVTIGVALFRILPSRVVDAVVAVMFAVGAAYSFWEARGHEDEEALVEREAASHTRVITTAFAVIFVAEWGDLTQILTANLAAHYHNGLSVAVGAALALWTVAAIAVTTGTGLLRFVNVRALRIATGIVLTALAIFTAVHAITG
jgi:putative Ca2+/H+ antiporter (TMEM165/GDT1 family)